jgi:hypothetical protein
VLLRTSVSVIAFLAAATALAGPDDSGPGFREKRAKHLAHLRTLRETCAREAAADRLSIYSREKFMVRCVTQKDIAESLRAETSAASPEQR